ncbi:MAG: DUF883 family protein [Betaproteobacteria bacterium]|nr:DUF883 family protein [Betaproteobacteria bacterium]
MDCNGVFDEGHRANLTRGSLRAIDNRYNTHSRSIFRKEYPPITSEVNKDKLVADLKVVVADAEELLAATAAQAGEKAAAARARTQASVAIAKVKLAEAERIIVEKAKETAKATDAYVHEHP